MIERSGMTEEFWLDDLATLETPENRQEAIKGTVERWATESLLAASDSAQRWAATHFDRTPNIASLLPDGSEVIIIER